MARAIKNSKIDRERSQARSSRLAVKSILHSKMGSGLRKVRFFKDSPGGSAGREKVVRFREFPGSLGGRKKVKRNNATFNRDTVAKDRDLKYFTCSLCEKSFAESIGYYHLRTVHKITIPFREQRFKNPDLPPDPNDKDNYCCTCEKRFSTRRKYLKHLIMLHLIYTQQKHYNPTQQHENPKFGLDPIKMTEESNKEETYCSMCNIDFFERKILFRHLRDSHSLFKSRNSRIQPTIGMDPTTCEQTPKSSIAPVTSQHEPSAPKKIISIGEHEIDRRLFRTFCSNCNRFFVCFQSYQKHLQFVHKLIVQPIRAQKNSPLKMNDKQLVRNKKISINGDVVDSVKYCTGCTTTFSTTQLYYRHLIDSHGALKKLEIELKESPPNEETSRNRGIHTYKCYTHDVEFKSIIPYVEHLKISHEFT